VETVEHIPGDLMRAPRENQQAEARVVQRRDRRHEDTPYNKQSTYD
jgi:hypothetical protein